MTVVVLISKGGGLQIKVGSMTPNVAKHFSHAQLQVGIASVQTSGP